MKFFGLCGRYIPPTMVIGPALKCVNMCTFRGHVSYVLHSNSNSEDYNQIQYCIQVQFLHMNTRLCNLYLISTPDPISKLYLIYSIRARAREWVTVEDFVPWFHCFMQGCTFRIRMENATCPTKIPSFNKKSPILPQKKTNSYLPYWVHNILEFTMGVIFFNSGSKSDPIELFPSIVLVIPSTSYKCYVSGVPKP